MKAFLSKFANSKIWCGLFMVLSLGLLILLVMEKSHTPGISNESPGIPNELERVKANYRERASFSRDTWVEFNDNDYMIEMKRTAYGREGEVELGENELIISRTD